MRVFVTGGTGLVGTRLIRRLRDRKIDVVLLTRRASVAKTRFGVDCAIVEGDPVFPGAWMDAVSDCDAVVHLAGENVFAHRWNATFKKLLADSRIQSTQNVVQALARKPRTAEDKAKVLVNASAVGYYGPHNDEELTEESRPGSDFLAQVCIDWENAARAGEANGLRVAMVRVGMVLDKEGGALKKLLTPFKFGVGGPVGLFGRQYVSWIHHDDLVGLFLLPLENEMARGPINGAAPNPVTSKEFARALGRALGRPAFMPTPKLALRALLGEAANVATTGQRVLPKKALGLGYQFKFPAIEAALANILA